MTAEHLDQPQAVRPGEEVDPARLAAYLHSAIPDLRGDLTVAQYPQGYSNLTYLLRLGERELVLRRPPFGSEGGTAHDMAREYGILRALAPVYDLVPQPLAYCSDETVIGAPFFVMARVPGVILRAQPPPGLDTSPAIMAGLAEAAIANLAAIHALPLDKINLPFKPASGGYVARQVEGWTRRYAQARTDDIPALERAAAWLAAHLPPDGAATLIHNDYKHDNLVLDPADLPTIRAVLDWEMATVGDPLMDLGTTLGYWVEAGDPPALQALRFGPTTLPGNPGRAALVVHYAAVSGRDVSNIVFYYVFGLFKIAGIAQQIYARYQRGHSHDPRFAGLIHAIRALGQTAGLAIDKNRLDSLQ